MQFNFFLNLFAKFGKNAGIFSSRNSSVAFMKWPPWNDSFFVLFSLQFFLIKYINRVISSINIHVGFYQNTIFCFFFMSNVCMCHKSVWVMLLATASLRPVWRSHLENPMKEIHFSANLTISIERCIQRGNHIDKRCANLKVFGWLTKSEVSNRYLNQFLKWPFNNVSEDGIGRACGKKWMVFWVDTISQLWIEIRKVEKLSSLYISDSFVEHNSIMKNGFGLILGAQCVCIIEICFRYFFICVEYFKEITINHLNAWFE